MTFTTQRLRHLAVIRASNVDKKSVVGDVPVELCNYVDVYRNEVITEEMPFMAATASPLQVDVFSLREGDVILTKDSERPDDIGVPAFVPSDLPGVICGYHLSVLRTCSDLLEPKFLYWSLQSRQVQDYFTVSAQGITRFALGYGDLGDTPIPLPSVGDQRAIVRFLDQETARIDALIDKKNRLQVLLLEEARAYLTSMLWANPLPDGWSMTPLMRLTQPSRPIMYGIVLPGPNVPEGVPLVKGGDVSNNRMHPNLLNKTTLEIEAPYARARLSGGDVLLTIRGRYGDAALVPDVMSGANITQDIARIAPRPEIDSKWLLRVLQSQPIVRKMFNEALGAAVQGVNIRDVKRYQVPLPPPAEQGRLASEIDDRLTTIEEAANSLAQATARLREYRSALITAAVTGQIDVGRAA